MNTFEDLGDLVVLEQYKNSIPENIANHICYRKVKTALEAAALADDYMVTHRRCFGDRRTCNSGSGETSNASGVCSPVLQSDRADVIGVVACRPQTKFVIIVIKKGIRNLIAMFLRQNPNRLRLRRRQRGHVWLFLYKTLQLLV